MLPPLPRPNPQTHSLKPPRFPTPSSQASSPSSPPAPSTALIATASSPLGVQTNSTAPTAIATSPHQPPESCRTIPIRNRRVTLPIQINHTHLPGRPSRSPSSAPKRDQPHPNPIPHHPNRPISPRPPLFSTRSIHTDSYSVHFSEKIWE